jgi:hypothetical protein
MTERMIVAGVALLLVALALGAMAGLHERHYKNRKWQLLESRVSTLEKIIVGEHD